MRLIFENANIDTLAWLNATSQFGVGSVRVDPQHSTEEEIVERDVPPSMIARAVAAGIEPKKLEELKKMKVKAKAKKFVKNPVISFDFPGDGNFDAVVKMAEGQGLKFVEKRDEIVVKSIGRILPPKQP